MDTKLKSVSVRPAAAFLCFVLGITILFSSAAALFAGLSNGYMDELKDALKSDYQDTAPFRRYISNQLDFYLRGAAQEDAQKLFDQANDPNLLYTVEGTEHWDNGYTLTPDGELPEGYNFLLYFDGEKVTIKKDGEILDVYGNGLYRPEEDDWYLPGYRNLSLEAFLDTSWDIAAEYDIIISDPQSTLAPAAGETEASAVVVTPAPSPSEYELFTQTAPADAVPAPEAEPQEPKTNDEPVTVCLAAASDPVYWTGAGSNDLYYLARNLHEQHKVLLALMVIPVAGLALLVLYIVMRKSKARADQVIAWGTGKIWLEVKLLLLIPLIAICVWAFVGVFTFLANKWFYEELFFAFPAFWCCYLYVNDLRYNGTGVFRNTLCGTFVRLFRAGDLRRPVQRRMVRRAAWQLGLAVPFFLFCAAQVPYLYHTRFYYGLGPILLAFVCIVALALIAGQVLLVRRTRQEADDLGTLLERIQAARAGRLDQASPLPADSDLREAADALDGIEAGMRAAVEQQTRSERMKVELISNVSHDLKTPLTSIISYAELLSQEEDLPDHVKDYIRILNEKAGRLSAMVKDVFEVSKAASGNLPVKRERLDLGKLLRQTLADMAEAVEHSGLSLKTQIPASPVPVTADGDRLYRVFQNLIQNALQYALPGSRVYLTLTLERDKAVTTVKNISRDELPAGVDFTERFVRGDESRTDGGSGLGLSIARTFTEACGGLFRVEVDADLFTAAVTLPLAEPGDTEENSK